MRNRMATSYSNIFMGHLEQQFLSSQKHKPWVWWSYINDIFIIWTIWTSDEENLQHFIKDISKFHPTIKMTRDESWVWWSYINYIFIIWTSGEENLQHFMNKFHPAIKMTRDWSYSVVTLLVIKIHLKNNTIHTDLYVRPTTPTNTYTRTAATPLITN